MGLDSGCAAASADDCAAALAAIGERGLPNLGARVQLTSEHDVAVQPFAGASAIWAREQHTAGSGGPGVALLLAGAVSRWLVAVGLSGTPPWDWSSASQLAALQAGRLLR